MYNFDADLIRISEIFLSRNRKDYFKICVQRVQKIIKIILKKDKVGGLPWAEFKTYNKATIIKKVQHWVSMEENKI
jgi:hypothetical protein